MNEKQEAALRNLCERYKVPFDENDYAPAFDLPEGWVSGWIGGKYHAALRHEDGYRDYNFGATLYVGCNPEGEISS